MAPYNYQTAPIQIIAALRVCFAACGLRIILVLTITKHSVWVFWGSVTNLPGLVTYIHNKHAFSLSPCLLPALGTENSTVGTVICHFTMVSGSCTTSGCRQLLFSHVQWTK